ncbi:hypothetical protein K466DRAFT_68436 [Polyporus arcularius HHB13444]|uniref:Uncharacterized protein n=1 Tax=Polyporus arcularius HHB13444 TaxID=1314778 RepID=A0A5C3PJK4_9APHY|nr:hypothetical protein K466DRAFT_68436 [Polyporus arcularius HHB13444]
MLPYATPRSTKPTDAQSYVLRMQPSVRSHAHTPSHAILIGSSGEDRSVHTRPPPFSHSRNPRLCRLRDVKDRVKRRRNGNTCRVSFYSFPAGLRALRIARLAPSQIVLHGPWRRAHTAWHGCQVSIILIISALPAAACNYGVRWVIVIPDPTATLVSRGRP